MDYIEPTYRVVFNQQLQVLDWHEFVGFENIGLRRRIRNQILYRNKSDLLTWIRDESNKLLQLSGHRELSKNR